MIVHPEKYHGTVHVPASKSDCQRAILAAGQAKGTSILHHHGKSNDDRQMVENIKVFGAQVKEHPYSLEIKGSQIFPETNKWNLGESGLGTRLMTSLCIVKGGAHEINGEGTLLRRQQTFFKEHFDSKGISIDDNQGFLPIQLKGKLKGGEFTVDGRQSSQYLSGLLMALPLAEEDSVLYVPELNSKPYVEMTIHTLRKFGISISYLDDLSEFRIAGRQNYLSCDYTIEGDWSSASYWLVASALGRKISVSNLSLTSQQADKAILKAFENANCYVEYREGKLFVDGRKRQAFEFDASHCPDLFPALASLAALTPGVSKIYGLRRLVDKESNRGLVLKSEMGKVGIEIILNENTDCMEVHGKSEVFGGKVFSNDDHRIAMCMAVVGMCSKHPVEIIHPEAVNKSYPEFWQDLASLGTENN